MLYLHCLIWIYGIYHLAKLCDQLHFNPIYAIEIVKFIDNIVYYLIADVMSFEDIKSEILSANFDKTNEDFTLKLYKNSNIVT